VERTSTGSNELDRVLGGGLVRGSVVLLGGEPGIGKSTILLQICNTLATSSKVLYVSGEESPGQLKLRAKRLGVEPEQLLVMTSTDIAEVDREIEDKAPGVVIVDSIQTMYDTTLTSAAGSVSQVRECTLNLIRIAKTAGISVIIVGHINKEGAVAGPKVLEHMVDAVLYFEGEKQHTYRIIRAIKNRFGPTNELGVFEMTDSGLEEVTNPSQMLLSGRPKNISGNCAVCVIEGTRPIVAEIQALVTPSVFAAPRRMANGIDYNRLTLLLAVLEKRLGLRLSTQDVYVNVVGGLRLEEPAVDLAVVLAVVSGYKDKPISDTLIAFGEIGLAGECRTVSQAERRIKEAEKLGFTSVMLPARSQIKGGVQAELLKIKSIFDALDLF